MPPNATRRREVLVALITPTIFIFACLVLLLLWSKTEDTHVWVDEPASAKPTERAGSLLVFQLAYAFVLLPALWLFQKRYHSIASRIPKAA